MKSFNWTSNIRTNIIILKVVGLWPLNDGTLKHKLYTLYRVILISLYLFANAVFQTVNIFLIKDIQILTFSIFMVITLYLVMIKFRCFYKNLDLFKLIIKNLNEEAMFQPKSARQKAISEVGLKLWKKLYITFCCMCIFCVFFWTTFPILDSHNGERRLLFYSWYPYNFTISPFYEITYFFQSSCIWFMALVSVSCDTLTTALMTYIGLQCDLLCDNLRNVGWDNRGSVSDEFIKCIKHHKKILDFTNQCNEFFSMVLLGQFSTSAVCIGLTMFQLTIVTPMTSEFYCLVFFGTSITTQMFQFCWFANEVQYKSDEISYSAFEMNFVEAPMSVKKQLIFFIAKTQEPIRLSVLNFVLSLHTFIKIIQTAWSYLTMLRQVSEKKV